MEKKKPDICPKCGNEKAEFYRNKPTGGWLLPCKKCKRESALQWIADNKERASATRKAYRESHKEQRAAYAKTWAKEHPRVSLEDYKRYMQLSERGANGRNN